jgi:hypothetical protein
MLLWTGPATQTWLPSLGFPHLEVGWTLHGGPAGDQDGAPLSQAGAVKSAVGRPGTYLVGGEGVPHNHLSILEGEEDTAQKLAVRSYH